MQKLKGLWIPAEILLDKKLSDKEKIILSMIVYLSEENKCCFASNKYFASIVNVTANRISKIISSLNTKEYINIKLKYKTDSKEIEERQIIPIVKNINRYCQNQQESVLWRYAECGHLFQESGGIRRLCYVWRPLGRWFAVLPFWSQSAGDSCFGAGRFVFR